MLNRLIACSLTALLAGALLTGTGCNKADDKAAQVGDKSGDAEGHGWWCVEHGMPEAECAQCDP